jgi:hypothetical protein
VRRMIPSRLRAFFTTVWSFPKRSPIRVSAHPRAYSSVASWTCSSVSPPLPSRHPGDVEQAQHGALAQVVVPL